MKQLSCYTYITQKISCNSSLHSRSRFTAAGYFILHPVLPPFFRLRRRGGGKTQCPLPVCMQKRIRLPRFACEYTSIVYAFCRGASFSIGALRRAGCTPALFAQPVCM